MNSILAIDPSLSSSGYAILSKESRKIRLCSRFVTKNDSKHGITENERIKDIVWHLYQVAILYDIKEVAMEDGFVGACMKTSLQLAKLRGSIITYFMLNGITVSTQPPAETRKNLGLKGNAKKEEVAEEILRLYPELIAMVGPYSDKPNKQKTSDMYDAVCIGIAHLNKGTN